jgi:hypothetical protein
MSTNAGWIKMRKEYAACQIEVLIIEENTLALLLHLATDA